MCDLCKIIMKLFTLYFLFLLAIMEDGNSPSKKAKKTSVSGASVKSNNDGSSFINSVAAEREKV